MELIVRLLLMPLAFVASVVFCRRVHAALLKWPRFLAPAQSVSVVGSIAVALCIAISIRPGVAVLNRDWPLLYGIAYRVCFLIGPPVFATLLIARAVKKDQSRLAIFSVPTAVCFIACALFLMGDFFAYEAAYDPS